MHQLVLRLRVERDCAWERSYHRKIRGRLDQALDGTTFDGLHDSQRAAFTFSEPMPYAPELEAGDELSLVVAAPSEQILAMIADDLCDRPELTAGAFVFDVRAAKPVAVDVGPPGSVGTLTTASGVIQTMTPSHKASDGVPTYWTAQDHSDEQFREHFTQSVQRLDEKETDGDPPNGDPFDRYEHEKTIAIDIDVTPRQQLTVLASKWNFGYEVRNAHHRRVLNTLLTHGVGAKRAYGFGCLTTPEVMGRG